MDNIVLLNVLSEICRQDLKLIKNRDALARLNQDSKEAKEAALKLEESIAGLTEAKKAALKKRKELDEKLQLEKANLRKWESRAEKIKGEREYTALMSEISSQKRTILGVEAEISEIDQELKSSDEGLLKATGAHQEKVERANSAYESVKEMLGEEEKRLESNEKNRDQLLEKIPKSWQMRYQRIYQQRSMQAIAFLRNEVCLACMRTVPPELYIKVCKGEIVEQCPSCQRIMVAEMQGQNPGTAE